jgi:hypothetical protein
MKLAQVYDMLAEMVQTTLHKNLQLSKKSARWVTKMLQGGDEVGAVENV